MNVVIIEDEKPSARRLSRMLTSLNVSVNTMLHSVKEAIQWFENNQAPDLLFLDVQLSDGLSFEIFENTTISSPIIFTTAYDQYALKAFKLNSIDYLLKPIDEEELIRAVEKFKNNRQNNHLDITKLKNLLNNQSQTEYRKRITIKIGQHIKILNTNETECFFSENKATYVHTQDGRSYLLDNSLSDWEESLNPNDFYRINRTYMVNINAIKDIISYNNSRLKIKLKSYNEQELIVSRERVKQFKEWIS